MCTNTKYSVSIIQKVFHYEETWVPVIKFKDEIWFKAVAVATILRYKNTMKSIRDHVDPEDKRKLSELGPRAKQNELFWLKTDPLKRNEGNPIYINESGLYSLILHSKLESARAFKQWVTKDVLPSIRKTGMYSYNDLNHKYNDSLTFKIENETDLHVKVVSFLKKRFLHSLSMAMLSENQDSVNKWMHSFYKGSPDLIIHNLHKQYVGLCTEIKTPTGNDQLSCIRKRC